ATGGNLLNTGPTYTTPVLAAATNYYVATTINGVTSSRTTVTVNVIASASSATISGDTVMCQGTSTTLTASGPAGSYVWYSEPTGGNKLSTGSSYTTPLLNYNATYYVQAN